MIQENLKCIITNLLRGTICDLEKQRQQYDAVVVSEVKNISSVEELSALHETATFQMYESTKDAIEKLNRAIECINGDRDQDFFWRYINSINI